MTYNFGTRQEENTSFQKQERVFYVFENSYFGSPIRNGLIAFFIFWHYEQTQSRVILEKQQQNVETFCVEFIRDITPSYC